MSNPQNFNPREAIGIAGRAPVYATSAFIRFLQRDPQQTTADRLPDPAIAGVGARAFITDADAPAFGEVATGGGGTAAPVYSDGSAWRIG